MATLPRTIVHPTPAEPPRSPRGPRTERTVAFGSNTVRPPVAVLARFEAGAVRVWFSEFLDEDHAEALAPSSYALGDAVIASVAFTGPRELALTLGDFEPGSFTLAIAEGAVRSAAGELAGATEVHVDLPDTVAPVVENFDPAPGSAIQPDSKVGFDVCDGVAVASSIIIADFPHGGLRDVVYDAGGFAPRYGASSREPIPGGFRFRISRAGGWPGGGGPTIRIYAVDPAGNRA